MSRKFLVASCLLVAAVNGRRAAEFPNDGDAGLGKRTSSKLTKAKRDLNAGLVGEDAVTTPRPSASKMVQFDREMQPSASSDVFTREEANMQVQNASRITVFFMAAVILAMLVTTFFPRLDYMNAEDHLHPATNGFVNETEVSTDAVKDPLEKMVYTGSDVSGKIGRMSRHGNISDATGFTSCRASDKSAWDSIFCSNRNANVLVGLWGSIVTSILFILFRSSSTCPSGSCAEDTGAAMTNTIESESSSVSLSARASEAGFTRRRRTDSATTEDGETAALLESSSKVLATPPQKQWLSLHQKKVAADAVAVALSGLSFEVMQIAIHMASRAVTGHTGMEFDTSSHMAQFMRQLAQISLTYSVVDSTAARRFLRLLGGSHVLQGMLTAVGHYHSNPEIVAGMLFGAVLATGDVAAHNCLHRLARGEERENSGTDRELEESC